MEKQGQRFEILEQTRVDRNKLVVLAKWGQQYVVGWNFDPSDNSWQQGHYFDDKKSAILKFNFYIIDSEMKKWKKGR
jgi:hypothetical protein